MVLFVIIASFCKSLRKKGDGPVSSSQKKLNHHQPLSHPLSPGACMQFYIWSVCHTSSLVPQTLPSFYLSTHSWVLLSRIQRTTAREGAWHPSVSNPQEADLSPIRQPQSKTSLLIFTMRERHKDCFESKYPYNFVIFFKH